jgi:hypothetical protein
MELLLFAAIIFKRIFTPVLFFFFETIRNVPFVFLSMTVKAFECARNVFLMENLNGGLKALLNPCLSSHGIFRHCLAMVIRLWLFLGVSDVRYKPSWQTIKCIEYMKYVFSDSWFPAPRFPCNAGRIEVFLGAVVNNLRFIRGC